VDRMLEISRAHAANVRMHAHTQMYARTHAHARMHAHAHGGTPRAHTSTPLSPHQFVWTDLPACEDK
jgi:hypothetical protein